MKKYILALTLGVLYSGSALATECSIQFGGGGKDSAVYSLKDGKETRTSNLGSPWSFVRSSTGPCKFTLYNKDDYKGRRVQYGATSAERIASKDGRDKGGWKVRSLIITPLAARCAIFLYSRPDKGLWGRIKDGQSYIAGQGFFDFSGPSSFSHLSALSGVGQTSGDSTCRYTLYNDYNFAGRKITVDRVTKRFRNNWRVRSIRITNDVNTATKSVPDKTRKVIRPNKRSMPKARVE